MTLLMLGWQAKKTRARGPALADVLPQRPVAFFTCFFAHAPLRLGAERPSSRPE